MGEVMLFNYLRGEHNLYYGTNKPYVCVNLIFGFDSNLSKTSTNEYLVCSLDKIKVSFNTYADN